MKFQNLYPSRVCRGFITWAWLIVSLAIIGQLIFKCFSSPEVRSGAKNYSSLITWLVAVVTSPIVRLPETASLKQKVFVFSPMELQWSQEFCVRSRGGQSVNVTREHSPSFSVYRGLAHLFQGRGPRPVSRTDSSSPCHSGNYKLYNVIN